MNKPEPLYIDGEIFKILGEDNPDILIPYVHGARMNLTPLEARQLRDWLTQFLEWRSNEKDS